MMAEQLNELVSRTEDGMGQYPDWKDTQAFIDALQAFLRNGSPDGSNDKAKKIKPGKDGILTVEDVVKAQIAG